MLHSIVFDSNGCNDRHLALVVKGMVNLELVRSIVYRNNDFADESVKAIKVLLPKRKPYNLEELRFVNCGLPTGSLSRLLRGITEQGFLKKLALSKLDFSDSCFQELLAFIEKV